MHESLQSPEGTILDIPIYSSTALRKYFAAAHSSTIHKYEAYLTRRKQGGPRELFPSQDFAIKWLRLAGVVKYVDGGWLRNVLSLENASLRRPGATADDKSALVERRAAKLAWQVISEEFGDGDLYKNHVYVYNRMLQGFGKAPTGDQLGFDLLPEDHGSPRCWTAAIAQQCIGLLAATDEFFPEALGFNMAYETLPYHLLITSRELRELGMDDYYFALHITIDNPDSGHAALALSAVERLLEGIRQRDGPQAMEQMWKRVQTGVVLADTLPTTPCAPLEIPTGASTAPPTPIRTHSISKPVPPTDVERQLIALLGRKAAAAEKMHCPSRILIKGHTIEHWLSPSTFSFDKGLEFLRALGEKKPWVLPGNTLKSRLVRELEWGGRMFGAFSREETALVKRWITSLGNAPRSESGSYRRFIQAGARADEGGQPQGRFVALATHHLLAAPTSDSDLDNALARFPTLESVPAKLSRLSKSSQTVTITNWPHLAALWFTSIAVLEQFPLSPSKFATPLGSAVLRILRAQLGFPALHTNDDICAGMDEVFGDGEDALGLWEIGRSLCRRQGFEVPASYAKLARSIDPANSTAIFCADMLELRSRPYGQQALLLGLTQGFNTHLFGSAAIRDLLASKERGFLDAICDDIEGGVTAAVKACSEIEEHVSWWRDFVKGYQRAKSELSHVI
jgi:hypothetical protein